MKKVLIVGEVYSSNLGDGVICDIVDKLLSDNYETLLFDLSGKNSYNKNVFSYKFKKNNEIIKQYKTKIINLIIKFRLKKSNNHIKKIMSYLIPNFEETCYKFKPDCIVFAGGQLFMDYFLNQIEYIVTYSEKNNIPVFFNACGIGKISKCNMKIVDKIINSNATKYVSLRDGYDFLKKYDRSNKVFKTFDTAILTSKFYKKNIKNEKLGLGVMYVKTINISLQIKFWSKIINYCEKNNIDWEMFSNGSPEDQKFIIYLLKLNNISLNRVHDRATTPIELINTVTSYKKIISMRMHSLIIAYSYNIAFVGIYWDEKLKEFMRDINLIKCCKTMKDSYSEIFKILNELSIDVKYKKNVFDLINCNINKLKEKIEDDCHE